MPRYSSRLHWSTEKNALTKALEASRPSLNLAQSNPTTAGIIYPPDIVPYEPDPRGSLRARKAVSEYYQGAITPDQLLLTASTSEAYSYLFKLLCDPGHEVLVPRPSYPLFDMLAQVETVGLRQYRLHYHDGWFIDLDSLRSQVNDRTRAIICVNPNNPTGSYLKRFEYEPIAELCNQHGLALISDEVFSNYGIDPHPETVYTVAKESGCLGFSLSGLSKVSGLPQMKLGWIAAGGPGHEEALERLEWISDTFLSVSTPVQVAAPEMLAMRYDIQAQIGARIRANLDQVRALHVEGGWYATLPVPRIRTEEEWILQLLDRGVLVQPGYFFDFDSEAFLILSLLTEPSEFGAGVRHILDLC